MMKTTTACTPAAGTPRKRLALAALALPLLLAAGASQPGEPVEVIEGGVTYGVLAMDSYLFSSAPSTGYEPTQLTQGTIDHA